MAQCLQRRSAGELLKTVFRPNLKETKSLQNVLAPYYSPLSFSCCFTVCVCEHVALFSQKQMRQKVWPRRLSELFLHLLSNILFSERLKRSCGFLRQTANSHTEPNLNTTSTVHRTQPRRPAVLTFTAALNAKTTTFPMSLSYSSTNNEYPTRTPGAAVSDSSLWSDGFWVSSGQTV